MHAITLAHKRWAAFVACIYVPICISANLFLHGTEAFGWKVALELFDSKGYHALGRQLLAWDSIDAERLSQRGPLYGALSGILLAVGPFVLAASQAFAIVIGLFFLSLCEARLTGRVLFAGIAVLLPSLWFAPARLMPEAFAFGLGVMVLWFCLRCKPDRSFSVMFCWGAALIKPAFLPVAVLFTVMLLFQWGGGLRKVPLLTAAFLVAAHIGLLASYGSGPLFSSAGSSNFQERFFPAVIGFEEKSRLVRYDTQLAESYRKKPRDLGGQVLAVVARPWATISAWSNIFVLEHLAQPSGYLLRVSQLADPDWNRTFRSFSKSLNLCLIPIWFVGLLGAFAVAWRFTSDIRLAVAMPVLVLGSAPLVYWQGDRVVFFALIMLLPYLSYALDGIFSRNASSPTR